MDDKMKRIMNNHIRSNDFYTLLPAVNLIKELTDYAKSGKADIVYRKCLRIGKYKLAEKIRIKYNLCKPEHDDVVTTMGFALLCANGR